VILASHLDLTIALVAAQARNGVIGAGNTIPWRVKGEQKLFRDVTIGGTLVMGRKTWDSIGRPLPGRETIVVTRQDLTLEGALIASSLEAAFDTAAALAKPCYVSGGGDLYAQTIDHAHAVHLTTIDTTVAGDIFFPSLPDDFLLVTEKHYESNINYTYRHFERR